MRKSANKENPTITTRHELQIEDALYLGDDGGIGCVVYLSKEKAVTIASITHLIIPLSHPLAPEIMAYQTKRIEKLIKMQGSGRPVRFTLKPRKKRKKR